MIKTKNRREQIFHEEFQVVPGDFLLKVVGHKSLLSVGHG